jgi:sec-independent protein translocase protein TatC
MSLLRKNGQKVDDNPSGEMHFLDHLEALRWHIIRSFSAVGILAVAAFVKVEWIVDKIILGPAHDDFVSYKLFCNLGKWLHVDSFCLGKVNMAFQNTAVAGQFMMGMSVSFMAGFVLAFPYIIWEFWQFLKPALRAEEQKFARGIVFWCSLLFFLGITFSYFIVIPYIINFFGNYRLSPLFQNIITMDNYFETVNNLVLAMGVVFELPVIVYFLTKLGIVTPTLLRKQRRYAILILFVISEIITPPDLFSCLLVFFPLYFLFEISVVISNNAVINKKS